MTWKGIVGRFVQIAEFKAHVDALRFDGWTPSFVVVHNTSEPDLALYNEWRAHPEKHGGWTPELWGRNLASYYAGMGWSGGPHAFVAPDGILLFTPFTTPGTHSPAWNSRTWGIETVGEFDREAFAGSPSHANLVALLGILHARIGLNPADYHFGVRGLHFHKEDPVTTHKSCPGKNMVKPDLVADVVSYIESLHPGDHQDIAVAVHTAPPALTGIELTSTIWLQQRLNAKGAVPQLATDGDLGEATRQAVRAFQQKNALVPDGIAGPLTRAKLAA